MSGSALDIKGKVELEMNMTIKDTCWEDREGHEITNWKEFNWKLKVSYLEFPL